jgi:hypothetical protein
MYTVIQNFGFSLPKHFGRQLLRRFRVQKFYPKLRGFEPKLWIFELKLRFFYPKLRVFENRSFVFLNQSCLFCKEFFSSCRNDSGSFCDRNFGILNPYEISVERKLEKFSKFRAKINYCVIYPKKKRKIFFLKMFFLQKCFYTKLIQKNLMRKSGA